MANTNTNTNATQEVKTKMPDNPVQRSDSERFTDAVLREFSGKVAGKIEISDHERSIIQGYFIGVDRALKAAEEKRLYTNAKNTNHDYDNNLPINWNTVNLTDLAVDIMYYARAGLDMREKNMLTPIPYKDNKLNKYTVTLMEGYNGIKYMAEKYALDPPKSVTVELVYSTDKFTAIKKNGLGRSEGYEFEITNPFDRGEVIGGFAFLQYDNEQKNTLVTMSRREIEKRKPRYASPEFWGGVKKEKVDGKWVETNVEGWFDKMARKTIIREAFGASNILIDPAKKDEVYDYIQNREARYAEIAAQAEIDANANKEMIDLTTIPAEDGEIEPAEEPQPEF